MNIPALVDADGRPIRLAPGPGARLLADRVYDASALRDLAAGGETWAGIPPRVIRKDVSSFSPRVWRGRNPAERFFNRIKSLRCLAT